MIILWADSAPHVGFGHIRRMITLYEFLKSDFDVCLACHNPSKQLREEFKKNGLNYLSLSTLEANEVIEKKERVNFIVFDGYNFTSEIIEFFKSKKISTMLIEDFNHCSKNPDVLLNHSPGANSKMYPDHHCLIGPRYCLVNPIFNSAKELERTKGQILLSFGGVDPLNLSLPSIKSLLLQSEEFQIILIAGTQERANLVTQQLSQKELEQVKILSNISSSEMAEFMATSEFGIFPSSTVAMEACQSKLPLIVTQTSDNQQLYRDGLLEKGLAIFIEPQQLSSEKSLSLSIEKLREQRNELRSAHDFYFDGNSKDRIINEIRNLIGSKK